MQWFNLLYILNIFCAVFSWRVAMDCFNRGDQFWGNFNLFASALNFVIVIKQFI